MFRALLEVDRGDFVPQEVSPAFALPDGIGSDVCDLELFENVSVNGMCPIPNTAPARGVSGPAAAGRPRAS